jgi:predicted DNA-binding mobile mystery protein A
MSPSSTARRHLDRRFEEFQSTGIPERPAKGWVRAIRDALGMTTRQLAQRIGISQPQVTSLEQDEVSGRITLARLRNAAEALDCRLVHTFIPNRPLEDTVKARAVELADRQLARTQNTMRLEDQAIDKKSLDSQRSRLIEKLLAGNPRRLWDDL